MTEALKKSWARPAITSGAIRESVSLYGCDRTSAIAVSSVVDSYGKGADWEYKYKEAFQDLLQTRKFLLNEGCRSLKSLDMPVQATKAVSEFYRDFERPIVAGEAIGSLFIMAAIPTPASPIVAAVALGAATSAFCLGIYRMFYE